MTVLMCECGNLTPLIDGICGACIDEAKADAKQKRIDKWEAMTPEQRQEFKFDRHIKRSF